MDFTRNYGRLFIKLASTGFVLLFVYAASSKLMDFHGFRTQLGQSPIVTAYADAVAWGIPLLEILIATLFFSRKWTLLAFYASFALMAMFTSYIVLVLNFSDFIPCSCGGVLEELGWTEHIVFNLGFVALALVAILIIEKGRPLKTRLP
ncbi:MauE/DoxX family redox-associated membrane protein [Flagellimonas sp.]|uniref:MauE/DoxX family redox-associated membrane protein n=1 Tax=Flagellimonas sp. TaxID=2058762 RepID=UPI003BAFDC74